MSDSGLRSTRRLVSPRSLSYKPCTLRSGRLGGAGGAVYDPGLIGALVYYLRTGTGSGASMTR
jgi:hypothetical protein